MQTKKIRIFLLIRAAILRRGVEHVLSFMEDVSISSVSEINEMLSLAESPLPEVAIVDIDLPAQGGLMMMRQLKKYFPDIGTIALTANYNETQIFQALKAQAAACLSKDVTGELLIDTVRRVAHGEHPIKESLITHPVLADQVFRQFQELFRQDDSPRFVSQLTPRETEILDYVARGFMNKQIAAKLGISEQTIKNHVTSILRKLNANARNEAVDVAIKQGWIPVTNFS